MSVKVTSLVLDHFPVGGGIFTLAFVLADRAGHDGGGIYYAIDTMAVLTRQEPRAVRYQLRELETIGWLVCVERSIGGRGNTTKYRIPIERIPQAVVGTRHYLPRLDPPPSEVEQLVEELQESLHLATPNAEYKTANPANKDVNPAPPCPQDVKSVTASKNKAVSGVADAGPPLFAQAWAQFPKRSGNNPRLDALKAWKARLAQGVNPDEMLAGVCRYAAFCDATGKVGTEHIMRGSTFFGPGKPYEQDFTPPQKPGPKPAPEMVCEFRDRPGDQVCGMKPAKMGYCSFPMCAHHEDKVRAKRSPMPDSLRAVVGLPLKNSSTPKGAT